MWTCPRCGRAFAAANQTHTCARLGDLEAHFAGVDPAVRQTFDRILEVVRSVGPVEVLAEKTRIALHVRMSFAALATMGAMALPVSSITRLLMGDFMGGTIEDPGRVVVTAFLVRHPDATILVDTGFAADLPPADVQELRIWRRDVIDVLGERGVAATDIDLIVNCHLHADHAGGNREFPGIPIYVQPEEVDAARDPTYTVAAAVDLDGLAYRVVRGEHEIVPGVRIVPTPGHSPGHQSVVVETADGRVVLAGQSFRWASQYGMALRAMHRARDGDADAPPFPAWLPRIVELAPARVVFAHDYAIWQAGT